MKETMKQMNLLWIFVILSLLIGLTLGFVIGSKQGTSTGEAKSTLNVETMWLIPEGTTLYSTGSYHTFCDQGCKELGCSGGMWLGGRDCGCWGCKR